MMTSNKDTMTLMNGEVVEMNGRMWDQFITASIQFAWEYFEMDKRLPKKEVRQSKIITNRRQDEAKRKAMQILNS